MGENVADLIGCCDGDDGGFAARWKLLLLFILAQIHDRIYRRLKKAPRDVRFVPRNMDIIHIKLL